MKTVTPEDIRRLIAALELSINVAALDPAVALSEQGVDSLDMIQLFFSCEQEFGVKINEKVLEDGSWNSMDGIASSVNRLIANQAA